jgi:hypothetical protein
VITPGTYRHFKGALYSVLQVGRHSETEEPMVIYTALNPWDPFHPSTWWVRPLIMFEESVTWPDGVVRPRFVLVPDGAPDSADG